MKKSLYSIILLAACMLLATACSDKDYGWPGDGSDVTVSTPSLSASTYNSLTLSSSLSGTLNNLVKQGFCYSSTNLMPTIEDQLFEPTGEFSGTITNLDYNTTYYVRAYAYVADRVIYSDAAPFTTADYGLDQQLADYVCPTYADDYRTFAGWDQRSQWNLANVHDPSVMLADDGYYYMYQTDASFGNSHVGHGHFHCRRSKNLVDWEYLGATMQSLPAWVQPKLDEIRAEMGLPASTIDWQNGDFGYWAPCARKVKDGLYRMYYSLTMPGYIDGPNTWGERAFIGMMETANPADVNSWEDKGYVITNASDRQLNFRVSPTAWESCYYKWNAIDPTFVITENGDHWLIYGSWHSGFAAVKLDAETGMPASELGQPWGDITNYGTRVYTRNLSSRWQASEGPEIIYRNGYYYLFIAYDELSVAYNTRVARSTSINGPFYGIDGRNVTNGGEAYPIVTHPYKFSGDNGWVGISHCAVFDDGQGNYFYASQQRFPADMDNWAPNAVMLGGVRSIRWTSAGWPVVMPERYGAVPQAPIADSELAGTWEHIDLAYNYGKQDTSTEMVLGDDHTITSGTWRGSSWSFDTTTNTLTINNRIELLVQREVDWEASPRKVTLVFAGINGTKTYWGKKK